MRAGQSAGPTTDICEIGMSRPSATSEKPPLNSAKVLVQMFLMIGQTPTSSVATTIITAPETTYTSESLTNRPRVNARPASAPTSTLKQDGHVERIPSGSKTTFPSTGQCWKK